MRSIRKTRTRGGWTVVDALVDATAAAATCCVFTSRCQLSGPSDRVPADGDDDDDAAFPEVAQHFAEGCSGCFSGDDFDDGGGGGDSDSSRSSSSSSE